MANFQGMCTLFRVNFVLRIEIEQMEEKLKFIKANEYLNLSVERLKTLQLQHSYKESPDTSESSCSF